MAVHDGGAIDRAQTRSMVISTGGIVAAEHPMAAQIGATLLAQGGNAVDAAVAANAAMGFFSPMMCGIGGDLFAMVYEADSGRLYGLNASGWSPAGLTLEHLHAAGHEQMPIRTINAVTVPGAVEGWHRLLDRFGYKSMAEVLEPAIYFAENGYPVPEWIAAYWTGEMELLKANPEAARVFMPGGRPPGPGTVFRNTDLADSYRRIARGGRDAFYEGTIAQKLVDLSRRLGGVLESTDLAEYHAVWVEPISTTYRGWKVYEIPPNGQGIAVLSMLNLMEVFPMSEYGHNTAETLHRLIECKKLAYADMLRWVGDPRFARPPIEALLSKDYARRRAARIDPARAMQAAEPGEEIHASPDTTYLCAVDRQGNMVSLIQSIYYQFGSGLVAPGTGFPLQNRGGLFTLEPGHPNVVAGRKRPLHTIIPAMMENADHRIAFGIMGGWNQPQAHAQFVANIVDFHMNIQQALEAPRFSKHSFAGRDVMIEQRVPPPVRAALKARGHELILQGDFSSAMGGGQAVARHLKSNVNFGASDPRKDGAAIPEPYGQIPTQTQNRQ